MEKRRKPSVVIAVCLATAGLFFLLPSLIALPVVRGYVQALISRQLSISLTVQSCSLGWWRGLDCEGLQYLDPARGFRVWVPRLHSDKGLLLLLLAPRYLGEITVTQPRVVFLPLPAAVAPPVPVTAPALTGKPWWEQLSCRFRVLQGRVERDQGAEAGQELASEIELAGSLAEGAIDYTLAFRTGGRQEGSFRARGLVNLPTAGQARFDSLISRAEVEIKDLELASFLDLAASRGDFPRGGGVLAATGQVITTGTEELQVEGETRLRGLHLAGGFLGQDQPTLDQLQCTFKGSRQKKTGWQLTTLKLASDPVQLEASGGFDQTAASLNVQGSLNLPVVAAQLPHLMALHQETRVQQGTLDFSLELSGQPRDLELKAASRTGRLAIVHRGQPYSWDTPLAVVAEIGHHQGMTTVHTLRARTPFLDAQASGGLADFTLRATADLGRMSGELAKLFALSYQGQGKLTLTGSSKVQADGRYRLATRIGIDQLALTRNGIAVLPAHGLTLTGQASVLPPLVQAGTIRDLRVEGDFWPGKFSLISQDSPPAAGKGALAYGANGVFDLDRLSRFCHGLAGRVPTLRWAGVFSGDSTGSWADQRLSVASLAGRIDRLAVSGDHYSHKEARVVVSLANTSVVRGLPVAVRDLQVADNWEEFDTRREPSLLIDFRRQRFDLRHLSLEAGAIRSRGSLLVADWRHPGQELNAAIESDCDGAFLGGLLKAAAWFPADLALKGRTRVNLATSTGKDQEMVSHLAVQMGPMELLWAQKKWLAAPHLALKARVVGALGGESPLKIDGFSLETAPLAVAGTGLVQRRDPVTLELQGTLRPDLGALSPLLTPLIGEKVAMTGRREGSFLLAMPLGQAQTLAQLTLAARVPVDSLRYRGLELRRLDLPIDLDRGRLQAVIAGEVGNGRLRLTPQWTFAPSRTLISLPAASQVLAQVGLPQPMIDRLLAPLHPLFGPLARPQGKVDLRLDDFSWSLAPSGRSYPGYTATLGLAGVEFKPAGVLHELLQLSGIEAEILQVKEQELRCTAREGRVSCPPLHLQAGEVELSLGGSVGKKGALAYQLQLPLPASPTAGAEPSGQPGRTIAVAITGTLGAPLVDRQTVQAAMAAALPRPPPAEPASPPVADPSSSGGP